MQSSATQKSTTLADVKMSVENSPSTTNAKEEYTAADAREAVSWMEERGGFTLRQRADYAHYDDKTLEALGNNGDVKALEALGLRAIEAGETEKSIAYSKRAALHGSIGSIAQLGALAFKPASTSKEDRPKMSREVLAHYKVIGIRGDELDSKLQSELFFKSYEQIFGSKLELAQEDRQQIDTRATEIYEDLQAKRRELGLGDFDNSVNQGMQKFIDTVKSSVAKN